MKKTCLFMFLIISFFSFSTAYPAALALQNKRRCEVDFEQLIIWINGKIKLITHLCCLFSTILGSLSWEMLYCHLYCNSKCYFSSSEVRWQKQPPEIFYKKGVLTNFSKFTGILETLIHVFSCEFSEICRITFFTKHLWVRASVFRTMSNICDNILLINKQLTFW